MLTLKIRAAITVPGGREGNARMRNGEKSNRSTTPDGRGVNVKGWDIEARKRKYTSAHIAPGEQMDPKVIPFSASLVSTFNACSFEQK